MRPDIFMDDFERTVYADAHYAAFGRSLTFATRFEAMCKALNAIVNVKKNRSSLESEDEIKRFVEKLYKLPLAQNISSIVSDKDELKIVLNKAREARNEIAHEITLGFDRCIDTLPVSAIQNMMKRLKEITNTLAEADKVVCFILSVVTNEPLPKPEFFQSYCKRVKQWVTESEDIV